MENREAALYNLKFANQISSEMIQNSIGMRNKYQKKNRIDNKIVLITGANTGIGKETAYQLSLRGAKIIIGCRDMKKAENAINDIKTKNPTADITPLKLDLASHQSVRRFVQSVSDVVTQIDILINNAGVMMCPEWKTDDGFEMQFGTNHLGHFLLTLSLLPLLKKSSKARVITVSSVAHIIGKINFENINYSNGTYNPLTAYGQSKLANVLFTRELARRLGPNSNVKTYALHPGIINSDLPRHMPAPTLSTTLMKRFLLSVENGAQTSLYCALEESLNYESGHYYDDCKQVPDNNMLSKATDNESAKKLWEMSCDFVKLEEHLKIN